MPDGTDPALTKSLVEAEGDVARHGIVIIRTIETDLVPTIMAAARDSVESSPRKLAKLSEDDLDNLMQSLRKAATKSVKDLSKLYTRVLSKLGNEDINELERDLEGIDQLFKWQRIEQAVEPVNAVLAEHGFPQLVLNGPVDVADNLAMELDEKWEGAFSRFSEAVRSLAEEARAKDSAPPPSGRKKRRHEGG